MSSRRVWGLCVSLASVAATPGRAAGSVAEDQGLVLVAPPRDAVEVPTDTLIWIDAGNAALHAGATETVLVDDAGERVGLGESSTITSGVGEVKVLRPLRLLQRDMVYGLWQCDEDQCLYELTRFRTGMGGAEVAPPVPEVSVLREVNGALVVDFEFTGVLVVSRDRVTLDATGLAGEVVGLGLPEQDVSLRLHESVVAARIGVFDYAGNFSGFSSLIDLDREPQSLCAGCDAGGGSTGPLALVLGLGLIARRRRGARRTANASSVRRPGR